MKVIFDLDGTIIDSSERMYRLFCKLVPQCRLTKEEYWEYKRNKGNHKKLIETKYPEVDFYEFNSKWMALIETDEYLDMDKNYPDTIEVLDKLKVNHTLYLLTARQSKTKLMVELRRLGLLGFFDKVMATEGQCTKEKLLEQEIKKTLGLADKSNIFISDMGKDIQLGKKIGYYCIGISHGFMSRSRLLRYEPDEIVGELVEILVNGNPPCPIHLTPTNPQNPSPSPSPPKTPGTTTSVP